MIKDLLLKELKGNNIVFDSVDLVVPPDSKFGDYSVPCFKYREGGESPNDAANRLKSKILKKSLIKDVSVIGPYLNFSLKSNKLAKLVLSKEFKPKRKNKLVLVEFPGPNTNKPLHLGHLRNMSLGESVSRILEFDGFSVKRVNILNDRGVHICKSMLAYQKWGNEKLPDKKGDHFVGDFYVLFDKKLKENPDLKIEAQEMLRNWESGNKSVRALWKKMNSWALKGFNETYKRFGIKHDKEYFESDVYNEGKKIVLNGLDKSLFQRNEKGDVIVHFDGLGDKVLLRADGTSVYITQDLYLAVSRLNDFKYDSLIYVVASEQDNHFKFLFKLLDLLGYHKDFIHLSYGLVNLPTGRMKSREGTVVDADELMDELQQMAVEELSVRKIKSNSLADKIGLAALKFHLLKFTPARDITFNPSESISFVGETGPYLQYSLVRAKRILSGVKLANELDYSLLSSSEEFNLVKKLGVFGDVVSEASVSHSPNLIAGFAFELCKLFNVFYEKHRVVDAESKELVGARLHLVKKYHDILAKCLWLLGIDEVDRM